MDTAQINVIKNQSITITTDFRAAFKLIKTEGDVRVLPKKVFIFNDIRSLKKILLHNIIIRNDV
jgi:hypothetical protein